MGPEISAAHINHLSEPLHNFLNQLLQLFAGAVRHLLDLLVGGLEGRVDDRHIRDAGDAEHSHAHVAERHAFTTGAHANRICAEHCIHFDFVGRLVRRTGDLQINAVCELDAQIVRCFVQECLQFFVINRADIREAHAELAVVGADRVERGRRQCFDP